jgi:hypothetical protein
VIWVEEQRLGPYEAEFQLDQPGGTVAALTIRAGDTRIPRREAPKYSQASWRTLLRMIEARPATDGDWENVVHYNFG